MFANLKLVEIRDLTPVNDIVQDSAERESFHRECNRREALKFSMLGLEKGVSLSFVKDDNPSGGARR